MERGCYHIGDVADMLGVSQRTVRYYEELGLIAAKRSEGGFRVFDDGQVERLRTILALKELGLSLEEIKTLVHLRHHGVQGSEAAAPALSQLKEKLEEFSKKIEKYKAMVKELKNVISIIEGCTHCENTAEESTCKSCVEEKTHHHVPPLMKTLL